MLSEKPWKLEAIARLLIGVFVCMCGGSLLGTALYHGPGFHEHITLFLIISVVSFIFLTAALMELGKPWGIENFRRRVGIMFACFYPGLILLVWATQLAGPPANTNTIGQMLIGVLCLQGAVLVLTCRMLRQQQLSLNGVFGFSNHPAKAIIFGVIVAGVFLEIGTLLQSFCHDLLSSPLSPIKPVEQQAVETLRTATSVGRRVVAGICTIGFAPLGEETLFRGIIYPTIKQRGFPKLAVWITSIGFATIHLNAETFLPLLVLALLLILLYEKTNNLLAPITAHAAFNAAQLIYLYVQEHQRTAHP